MSAAKTQNRQQISKDHIVWAYKLLLDREPEGDLVVQEKLAQIRDARSLREEFLRSNEYRQLNPDIVRRSFAGDEPPMKVETKCSNPQMRLLFSRVKESWQQLGKDEPYWSVLVCDRYRASGFTGASDEFFETGKHSAGLLKAALLRNGFEYARVGNALEFGCGVGRVTRWLAKDGLKIFAYDISKSHLEIAKKHAEDEWKRKIVWKHLRSIQDLSSFPKVDLAYSIIVLQHNPPPLAAHMIRAMLLALKPNGLAVFQVPTYRYGYRFAVSDYLEGGTISGLEMHVLPQTSVFEIIQKEKCKVLEVFEDGWIGNREKEVSNTFVVQKSS